jgi:phage shock protein A
VTETLDSAVAQLENHDAIVDATIKQTRQAVAKTKARINTLRQQENAYTTQLAEAVEQRDLWTKRAAKFAVSDQGKALQCVARLNQSASEIKRLTSASDQQKELIHDVNSNLQKLQKKLDEMTQKHNLMRSRQTVADVNRAMVSVNVDDSLSGTFERWESAVLEHELAVSDVCSRDSLDMELSQGENQEDLIGQLAEITSSNANKQAADQKDFT